MASNELLAHLLHLHRGINESMYVYYKYIQTT